MSKKAKMPALSDLMADLQTAKEIAIRNENANSLVTATMAQAKLLGLDKGGCDDNSDQEIKINIIRVGRTPIEPTGELIQ